MIVSDLTNRIRDKSIKGIEVDVKILKQLKLYCIHKDEYKYLKNVKYVE